MRRFVAVAFTFLLAGQALAEDGLEGRFAATAFGAIEPRARLRIELLDDSDLNLRLLEDFERALTGLGYAITGDGDYELTFVTEEITDVARYGDSTIFRLQVDTQGGANPNTKQRGGTEARTTLWSSTQNSLFARRASSRSGQPLLRMEVEVRALADKPRIVWAARAETLTRRSDFYALFQQMVPVLTESIGQTVAEDTIILR